MDSIFRSQIIKFQDLDNRLKKLFQLHQEYERELQIIERRKFLTMKETLKIKELKIKKARGKEIMNEIVSEFEKAA